MGFFQKIKELANLKKEIEKKQTELKDINDIIINKEKSEKKLEDRIHELDLQLTDRESTMKDIKDTLSAENERIRQNIIDSAKKEAESIKETATNELSSLLSSIDSYKNDKLTLEEELERLSKEVNRYLKQARKFKSEIIGLKEYNKKYKDSELSIEDQIEDAAYFLDKDGLFDTIIKLPLHSDNSKELRKLSNDTRREINNLLDNYKERYTTKGNRAIYKLMIIGLQAEMQLLLFKLTYQKLEETKILVKEIIEKYLIIAGEGNKSILGTLTRFISEIEPLYLELVDIEYKYYIKRQQEKEEQQAIKERMQQEKEERKALEAERKKLDREESKFKTEMERNTELLETETDDLKIKQLQDRLQELQQQLEEVELKKEEVTSLAMGKAGYVYIISNLGSFGDNTFKIGMTRRLEPQQRVDELGSASVPFKFDVHALIFSDDAVGLENALHKRLSNKRVNKVNFRKEFFRVGIDQLEELVEEIDPTADFTKTMYAEEYQQTLALEESSQSLEAIS
ncbi:GIY-YIG nuclease family protein [Enterococcus casseliflavus]|uniref:GIY-YIG nuclease family protein n=1 Tax=Enterococcus casseliflavus TaxID=37734 RepID=UPI002330F862|nr:GIY-YIG nuclease family protein [Enterococcus casseliflavus]MDB1687469.1 GIY-YIG nuclease family protein [Enterococcus casseliflavus]